MLFLQNSRKKSSFIKFQIKINNEEQLLLKLKFQNSIKKKKKKEPLIRMTSILNGTLLKGKSMWHKEKIFLNFSDR